MPVLLPLRGFGYPEFCRMMDDDSTIYIRKQIEDFIESFSKACSDETMLRQSSGMFPAVNDGEDEMNLEERDEDRRVETLLERQRRRGKEYLKIIESFAMVILKDPFWALMSADGKNELDHDSDEMALYFELIFSFLEIFIVPRIHRYLFVPDKKADWDIAVKCLEYEWIRPIHLDLRFLPEDLSLLVDKANSVFTEMAFEPIPSLKANHLGTVWKLVEVFFIASKGSPVPSTGSSSHSMQRPLPSMDDIFPILVYTLIRTHPPQLSSDLEYLSVTCREMTSFGSFTAFYVTSTQVALEFVKNMSHELLSKESDDILSPTAHSDGLREALTQAIPINFGNPVASSSSTTHTVDNGPKSSSFATFSQVKNRLSKTVEKVADHVSGTVSLVSSLSPISAVASVVRSPISKKLSPSAPTSPTEGQPSCSATNNSIMASWINIKRDQIASERQLEDSYRFYKSDPSQLSPEDILHLLEEYKSLAHFHFKHS